MKYGCPNKTHVMTTPADMLMGKIQRLHFCMKSYRQSMAGERVSFLQDEADRLNNPKWSALNTLHTSNTKATRQL